MSAASGVTAHEAVEGAGQGQQSRNLQSVFAGAAPRGSAGGAEDEGREEGRKGGREGAADILILDSTHGASYVEEEVEGGEGDGEEEFVLGGEVASSSSTPYSGSGRRAQGAGVRFVGGGEEEEEETGERTAEASMSPKAKLIAQHEALRKKMLTQVGYVMVCKCVCARVVCV